MCPPYVVLIAHSCTLHLLLISLSVVHLVLHNAYSPYSSLEGKKERRQEGRESHEIEKQSATAPLSFSFISSPNTFLAHTHSAHKVKGKNVPFVPLPILKTFLVSSSFLSSHPSLPSPISHLSLSLHLSQPTPSCPVLSCPVLSCPVPSHSIHQCPSISISPSSTSIDTSHPNIPNPIPFSWSRFSPPSLPGGNLCSAHGHPYSLSLRCRHRSQCPILTTKHSLCRPQGTPPRPR